MCHCPLEHLVIFNCSCSLVRFSREFPSPLEERNLVKVETDFSHAFVSKISPALILLQAHGRDIISKYLLNY